MVAGKVRAAMGFQRSPSTPKPETPRLRHHNCGNTNPPPSAAATTTPLSSSKPSRDIHSNSFSRSFGSYFPRSSPAQVRPKPTPSPTPPPPPPPPPNISDLLRLVEDLQEKESRLRTELLEHKILKETVAIVPFLEKELAAKATELDIAKQKALAVEAENQFLRLELEKLQGKIRKEEEVQEVENRIKEMEDEIEDLKRAVAEQGKSNGGAEECCSSNNHRSRVVFEAPARQQNQVKILRRTMTKPVDMITHNPEVSSTQQGLDSKAEEGEAEKRQQQQQQQQQLEVSETVMSALKSRAPRVPRPPPTPTCSSSSSTCSSTASSSCSSSVSSASSPEIARRNTTACPKPAPPPPPPPVAGMRPPGGPPPPPPPPPKSIGYRSAAAKVRRVPEVVEFYHSLMRRDSKREANGGGADSTSTANTKDMIGEIENRSAYLLAIKTDVETQGDFIRFLIKEVENAAFSNIEDVVAFVKWLDDELSFLVDERAVLKHFDWPEKKADAMREAAFGFGDLKKVESEAASYKDGIRQPCAAALKKMQSLLDKLEHGVYNLSRVREAAMKRYKVFGIPGEWMLDTGFVIQIKLASVKLAMQYMKRVSAELESVAGGPEEEELVLQGVRFAFRVHQFAGGFDVETMRAFQELRDKARSCPVESQNQGPKYQRLACRA